MRLVTHNDVSFKDCQHALDAIKKILGSQEAAEGFSSTHTNGAFAPTGYK